MYLKSYFSNFLHKQRSGGNPMTIAYCRGIVTTTKNINAIQTLAKVPLDSITKISNHNA